MSPRHNIPAHTGEAAASSGTRYWTSEYERIHLMTAARIRGERLPVRRP